MENEKFLEVLNKDPKAKELLERFNEMAKRTNMTDEEYKYNRQTIVFAAMAMNKEIMHDLALDIWEDVNKG